MASGVRGRRRGRGFGGQRSWLHGSEVVASGVVEVGGRRGHGFGGQRSSQRSWLRGFESRHVGRRRSVVQRVVQVKEATATQRVEIVQVLDTRP